MWAYCNQQFPIDNNNINYALRHVKVSFDLKETLVHIEVFLKWDPAFIHDGKFTIYLTPAS